MVRPRQSAFRDFRSRRDKMDDVVSGGASNSPSQGMDEGDRRGSDERTGHWNDGPAHQTFTALRNKPSKRQTFTDYWIAGWRSQYRCPPASSPLSFRFGGPPSLSTLPVNW